MDCKTFNAPGRQRARPTRLAFPENRTQPTLALEKEIMTFRPLDFVSYREGRQLLYQVHGETYMLVRTSSVGFALKLVSAPGIGPILSEKGHRYA